MMPMTLPAGADSTTTPAHTPNSHHRCSMMAAPPTAKSAITTATRAQEAGRPCRWVCPPIVRS